MPRTKPGLQFNSPSVTSLKYYPRNEIRDPEYRVRGSFGSRMETWPDSVAKRRPASPPQVAWLNICPPPLGCLDASTQPPSHHSSALLRSGKSWHGHPGRAPKPRQKVSPDCHRSRKFTNLERMGFAFLKPQGHHLGSHMQTKRGTGREKKKEKHCQTVFVLFNDLEKGTLRTRQAVSPDFSELVFHIHYLFSTLTWRGFNCLQFRLKSERSGGKASCLLRGRCGKSTTSTLNLIDA